MQKQRHRARRKVPPLVGCPREIVMYHGTNTYADIVAEGRLWGKRNAPSRCTYLASTPKEAKCYGKIVLEVRFRPSKDKPNNWIPGCWQCRVYAPIPTRRIRVYDWGGGPIASNNDLSGPR